jgi:hypothetical protein
MKIIEYNLEEKNTSSQNHSYFGNLEIIYDNDNKLTFLFIDHKKGEVGQLKKEINYSHKGIKIGKAIKENFEINSKIIFKNINFKNYDFYQPDMLLNSIFKKTIKIDLYRDYSSL